MHPACRYVTDQQVGGLLTGRQRHRGVPGKVTSAPAIPTSTSGTSAAGRRTGRPRDDHRERRAQTYAVPQ